MLVPQFLLNGFHNLIADKLLRGLAFKNLLAPSNTYLCHTLNIILQDPQNVLQRLFICLIHFHLYHAFDLLHVLGALLCICGKSDLLHLRPVFFAAAAVSVLCSVKCQIVHTIPHVAGVGFGITQKAPAAQTMPHAIPFHEMIISIRDVRAQDHQSGV